MEGLTVVRHPLVQHKLTLLRDRNSSIQLFRTVVREIATLLCYEVTRDLPTETVRVETPIAATDATRLSGKKLVVAPILRAGLQMAEGMLDLVPSARLAHVGLYRDPLSLQAVEYYFKTPEDCAERLVIVVDPMLATGHTAVAAVDRLKEAGEALRFVRPSPPVPVPRRSRRPSRTSDLGGARMRHLTIMETSSRPHDASNRTYGRDDLQKEAIGSPEV
jgi:uracil phosphoribosyltransferase